MLILIFVGSNLDFFGLEKVMQIACAFTQFYQAVEEGMLYLQ